MGPQNVIRDGQTLIGRAFSEPMRVVTVRPVGDGTLEAGLVGQRTQQFRQTILTATDIAALQIVDAVPTYEGDGRLLRLGLQAHALGIAHEFDPYFSLSISRVDPLPHQLEAVYAHKTTEGWEALLSGMIRGGWTITGSWPIATEMSSRLRAHDSAALATSVHLVCRPRPEDAPVGDWADVLQELPGRVANWVRRLQGEGIRGADLVFACIGPALEVYSRYSRVETPGGREVALAEYLERVWEVVGREALEQVLGTAEARARNGHAGALEEDARLTALFLWTMQATEADTGAENGAADDDADDGEAEPLPGKAGGYSLPFDVARRFAQPLGIHLDEWESRVIETKKGVVQLLPVRGRGRQLFGEAGAGALADEIESDGAAARQLSLLPEEAPAVRGRSKRRRGPATVTADLDTPLSATTLDRVHAAMLLQASGRSQALRALLRAEQERGPDFLRLANALSALYPRGSDEKRLLDAMLLAAPR